MSGIEIAGLVLGSFPVLLNCLDYYRRGFEPLEEWWNFRTHFINFIDDIRHQMMRYNENMIQLLDPIIADNESLYELVQNAKDPRWTDGSLAAPLEQRLASEYERFLRVVNRMDEVVRSLERLLQIKDGNVCPEARLAAFPLSVPARLRTYWFLARYIGLDQKGSGHGNGI
jgi:hypothetical protein